MAKNYLSKVKENLNKDIAEFKSVKEDFISALKTSFEDINKSIKGTSENTAKLSGTISSVDTSGVKEVTKALEDNARAAERSQQAIKESNKALSEGVSVKPKVSIDTSSILSNVKGLSIGGIIANGLTSVLSSPDLQEPLNKLKASVSDTFGLLMGKGTNTEGESSSKNTEDSDRGGINGVFITGIETIIQLLEYLKPLAESIGGVVSSGFEVISNIVGIASEQFDKFCDSLSLALEYLKEHKLELFTVAALVGVLAAGIALYLVMQNLSAIATGVATGIMNIYAAAATIGASVTAAFGAVMAFLTSPIFIVTAAIMGIIVIIYALIKNWDNLKEAGANACEWIGEKVSNLANSIKEFFAPILDPILEKFNSIKEGISNAWDFICGLFNKVLKPNIKMPKIEVTGKFSLNPLQVPKFGIGWYQTGGIFTGPSVIGVGENGDEAVLPLSNKRRMKPFANAVASMMSLDTTSKATNNKGVTINIDNMSVRNDMDIKKIAEEINRLVARENRKLGII